MFKLLVRTENTRNESWYVEYKGTKKECERREKIHLKNPCTIETEIRKVK